MDCFAISTKAEFVSETRSGAGGNFIDDASSAIFIEASTRALPPACESIPERFFYSSR
jgi:hypothetical protein